MDACLLLPECLEDGGALSLPRCEDDDGAWGGAGGGVREGGVTYPFPVLQGEGKIALGPSQKAKFKHLKNTTFYVKIYNYFYV